MQRELMALAQPPAWVTYASLAVNVGLLLGGIPLFRMWEERRRPRVKLVVDVKTKELRVEIVNRSPRELRVRDIAIVPDGDEPLPIALDRSWNSESPVKAYSSLIAKADMNCLLRLHSRCAKLNPHRSVSVRGRFKSGMGKQYRSKPMFYDVKTQRLTEKEPE